MKCLWCGTVSSEAHVFRMISYLVCCTDKNVKPCKGKKNEVLMEQQNEIFMAKNSQTAGKKHTLEDSIISVSETQLASSKVLV